MRALPIVSTLVLTFAVLSAACSAQSDGTRPESSAGAPAVTAGSGNTTAGSPGAGGSPGGFAGSPAAGGSSNGFAGASPGAGAPGTAGAGPITGGGCATTKAGAGTDGLIDNFEMHPASALIPATDGRVGGWWISMAATGTVTMPTIPKTGGGPLPVMGGMGGGMALHFTGTDSDMVNGWGADASVAISGMGSCYDASIYTGGIKVSLMGTGSVYVSVITAQDKAMSMTSGNQRKEIAITSTWTDYTIPWADLATGWGTPIPLDLKSIVALDIAPSASSASNFDIWIDNLQFVK